MTTLVEAVVPPSEIETPPDQAPLEASLLDSPIGLPTVSWPVTDVTATAAAVPSPVNVPLPVELSVTVVDAPEVTGAVQISDTAGSALPLLDALTWRVQVSDGELATEKLAWVEPPLMQSMVTTSNELL